MQSGTLVPYDDFPHRLLSLNHVILYSGQERLSCPYHHSNLMCAKLLFPHKAM